MYGNTYATIPAPLRSLKPVDAPKFQKSKKNIGRKTSPQGKSTKVFQNLVAAKNENGMFIRITSEEDLDAAMAVTCANASLKDAHGPSKSDTSSKGTVSMESSPKSAKSYTTVATAVESCDESGHSSMVATRAVIPRVQSLDDFPELGTPGPSSTQKIVRYQVSSKSIGSPVSVEKPPTVSNQKPAKKTPLSTTTLALTVSVKAKETKTPRMSQHAVPTGKIRGSKPSVAAPKALKEGKNMFNILSPKAKLNTSSVKTHNKKQKQDIEQIEDTELMKVLNAPFKIPGSFTQDKQPKKQVASESAPTLASRPKQSKKQKRAHKAHVYQAKKDMKVKAEIEKAEKAASTYRLSSDDLTLTTTVFVAPTPARPLPGTDARAEVDTVPVDITSVDTSLDDIPVDTSSTETESTPEDATTNSTTDTMLIKVEILRRAEDDFAMLETRFVLQHGDDDDLDDPSAPAEEFFDVLECRFALQHGDDDDCEEALTGDVTQSLSASELHNETIESEVHESVEQTVEDTHDNDETNIEGTTGLFDTITDDQTAKVHSEDGMVDDEVDDENEYHMVLDDSVDELLREDIVNARFGSGIDLQLVDSQLVDFMSSARKVYQDIDVIAKEAQRKADAIIATLYNTEIPPCAEDDDEALNVSDIVLVESLMPSDIAKSSIQEMINLQDVFAYGREVDRDEGTWTLMVSRLESTAIPRHRTPVSDSIDVFDNCHNIFNIEDEAPTEADMYQHFLGTMSFMDFTDQLSSLSPSSGTHFSKNNVARAFATLCDHERELAGLDSLTQSGTTKNLVDSTLLQHRIRIGRTKLGDFLELLGHDNGEKYSIETILKAWMKASIKEEEWRATPIGRSISGLTQV